MGLQFWIGRAGTGKTTQVWEEFRRKLEAEPNGTPLIYLVPEQGSFQAEYALATLPGLGGTMRAQVLSFKRLAYRVMQELGGTALIPVDELGKHMVLRMLVEKHQSDLRVFARSAHQPGFIGQLGRMISECKRYGIHADLLDPDAFAGKTGTLPHKLHDLRLLLKAYDDYVGDRYFDADDMLTRVAEQLVHSSYLRDAEVWIDGFSGFTRQEFAMIQGLMRVTRRVTVLLTADPGHLEREPDELDLFFPTHKTYVRLFQLARETGVEVEETRVFDTPYRFRSSPALRQIEQTYFHWGKPGKFPEPGDKEEVILAAAPNRRAEVQAAATHMLALARDEGYRWRDMTVLVREMGMYAEEIRSVFEELGIPYFLDHKRSVMHHPAVELIRSALETVQSRWKYEAVFRCLKTELVEPLPQTGETQIEEPQTGEPQTGESQTGEEGLEEKVEGADEPNLPGDPRLRYRYDVDVLENYVLAYGIQEGHWRQEEPWTFHGERDAQYAEIDAIRRRYAAPLLHFQASVNRAVRKNVRELTTCLYQFLEEQRVPEKLERWMEEAERSGRLEEAREHEQVWNGIVDLLDQIVEVMGEECVDLPTFIRVLDAGLESIRLGLVPPSLDSVVVGTMERSRQPHVRMTFLLGVNDGIIPMKPKEDGLLDEAERELLLSHGLELAPTAKERLLSESFLLYGALTRSSERLWLSCSLSDEEGKGLMPSSVFGRMREILPHLKWKYVSLEPTGDPQEDVKLAVAPYSLFRHLLTMLRQVRKGRPLPPFWWEVYHWFVRHPQPFYRKLLSGLVYGNKAVPLTEETSRALYGNQLRMSVTRLERFQACPFAHFSSHGLRLSERQIYRLERFDIGELFHASLKRVVEVMREHNMDWAEVTEEAGMKLAHYVVDEMIPQTRSHILTRTARYRFVARKLKQAVGRAIVVLGEHAKRSRFAPVGLEISFGPGGELPGLSLPVKDGITLQLIGRIDRVDQSIDSERKYLRVIDYKSGSRKFDLSDAYNGLHLQLLVYIDVVIENAGRWLGEEAEFGGVFYYQVADPVVKEDRILTEEEWLAKRAKQLRMNGLMLEDLELARLMDSETTISYDSPILPFGITKDGQFKKTSKVASSHQLKQLQGYVRQKVSELSRRMVEGETEIHPYQLQNRTACDTCVYKPICQFDQAFADNRYNVMKKWRDQEVWERLLLPSHPSEATGGEKSDDDNASKT